MEIDRVGGVYEGELDPKREKLAGTWTQSGHTSPLELARGGTPETAPSVSSPRPKPLDVPLKVKLGDRGKRAECSGSSATRATRPSRTSMCT